MPNLILYQKIANPTKTALGKHVFHASYVISLPQAFDSKVFEPEVYLPGAGSDHASFIFFAGVPVIDTTFDPVSFSRTTHARC